MPVPSFLDFPPRFTPKKSFRCTPLSSKSLSGAFRSPAPASWGLNDQAIAGLDIDGSRGGQFGFLAASDPDVDAACSPVASCGSVRRPRPARGDQRNDQRSEKLKLADDSVATAVPSPTSASLANRKPMQSYGEPSFEDFRIGDPGIGHVGVNRVGPVMLPGRATAATDRFVIAEGRVANQHIVHGALRSRRDLQCSEQDIDDPLTGLDVSRDNRCASSRIVVGRRIKQPRGDGDVDVAQDAIAQRKI